ncbi:hypothetical protein HPP92_020850 [Vanilla planifolia]|uniref:Uncharacterized protein n=1 Tax=Vanilla planifolia TaxID=51239 RepID=A0A835Q3H1_VANPL|nr:hypothetical protein HPP92_020850 [Vanilla planifolia]
MACLDGVSIVIGHANNFSMSDVRPGSGGHDGRRRSAPRAVQQTVIRHSATAEAHCRPSSASLSTISSTL